MLRRTLLARHFLMNLLVANNLKENTVEKFEHSKALKRTADRKVVVRELKILAVALVAGALAFFVNGGMNNLFWAGMAGAAMAAISGTAAQMYFE